MSDQTIHNVTSLDWVVIDWIGENRTVSASGLKWLEWHDELHELRAERDQERHATNEQIRDKHRILGEYQTAIDQLRSERDALATELARLRRLEEAAIHWNTHRCVHGVGRLERAIAEAAREAEKARG